MRSLNLSYNILNTKCANPVDSEEFMSNITKFCNTSKSINHVNFSGMNLYKSQVLNLLEHLRECKLLVSIHLSDAKGMNAEDKEFYYDCLEKFGITEEDLLEINRSLREEVKVNEVKY